MLRYYHCSPLLLDVGSVILPGNWGRLQKMAALATQIRTIDYIDYALERERIISFPDKPSRWNSCFVCPHETFIQYYAHVTNIHNAIIYEVEMVDGHKPCHTTFWNFKMNPNDRLFEWLDAIAEEAKLYWSWDDHRTFDLSPGGWLETITESPIRVIRRIDISSVAPTEEMRQAAFHEVVAA